MKKEIGGYLELEESTGQEYYPELCGVNLGRTALLLVDGSSKLQKNLSSNISLRFCDRSL
mgnify:CR=1 FL=1